LASACTSRKCSAFSRPVFDATDMAADGGDFDDLFGDGERFRVDDLEFTVMSTPGHTPADVTYLAGDSAFVGDTLFMPDYGTARADFPGGDARLLYRSIQRLLSLPPATRIFVCHDYKAPGRDQFAWESSVAEQLKRNVHVGQGASEEEFVAMRTARDSRLSTPRLLLPSIQYPRRPLSEGRGQWRDLSARAGPLHARSGEPDGLIGRNLQDTSKYSRCSQLEHRGIFDPFGGSDKIALRRGQKRLKA
jgi:hypothetical protein